MAGPPDHVAMAQAPAPTPFGISGAAHALAASPSHFDDDAPVAARAATTPRTAARCTTSLAPSLGATCSRRIFGHTPGARDGGFATPHDGAAAAERVAAALASPKRINAQWCQLLMAQPLSQRPAAETQGKRRRRAAPQDVDAPPAKWRRVMQSVDTDSAGAWHDDAAPTAPSDAQAAPPAQSSLPVVATISATSVAAVYEARAPPRRSASEQQQQDEVLLLPSFASCSLRHSSAANYGANLQSHLLRCTEKWPHP